MLLEDARRGELLVRLIIEVVSVGHDHEGPVPRQGAEHLLGEEDHRHRLARALRVPEDAELRWRCSRLVGALSEFLQATQRVVHTEVLVVASDELDEPAGQLLEEREVADDVEEAVRRSYRSLLIQS